MGLCRGLNTYLRARPAVHGADLLDGADLQDAGARGIRLHRQRRAELARWHSRSQPGARTHPSAPRLRVRRTNLQAATATFCIGRGGEHLQSRSSSIRVPPPSRPRAMVREVADLVQPSPRAVARSVPSRVTKAVSGPCCRVTRSTGRSCAGPNRNVRCAMARWWWMRTRRSATRSSICRRSSGESLSAPVSPAATRPGSARPPRR